MKSLLLESFETLADAPNAVPKLRELILQLAVRGRLVPQDENDEPASRLLEKIQGERKRAAGGSRARAYGDLPPIAPDEVPYALPATWRWVRLSEWGEWGAGSTPDRARSDYYGGDMSWFKSGELKDCEDLRDSEEHVTGLALEKCSLRVGRPGEVLIAMYGATIGRLGILGVKATTNQAVCACTCYSGVLNRYLFLFLRACRPTFLGQGAGGAQPNISKVKIVSMPAALPPFPEQERIVARVDELMARCDELEARQQAKRTKLFALNRACLRAVTQPNGTSLRSAWHRVRDSFDDLYCVPETVAELRQTVLQLAVMGRLVPQDPRDEPASDVVTGAAIEGSLLAGAARQKTHTAKSGMATETPFRVPSGWTWVNLGGVATLINGDRSKNYPSQRMRVSRGIPFINAGHLRDGIVSMAEMDHITEETFDVLRSGKVQSGDVLYCIRGSLGKAAVVADLDRGAIASSLVIIRPSAVVDSEYMLRYLTSPLGQAMIAAFDNGSAQPNLSAGDVRRYAMPLPPVAEQKRIVARVSQLMTLCDDLEAKLQQAQADADSLLGAVVHELVSPGKAGG